MDSSPGDVGESGSVWPGLDAAVRLPLPDFTDATSDLSASVSPFDNPDADALGLSVLPPGILDLSAPRKDLVDSFVSALLKEG